jgi:two-component system chemotaxis response regulator CheY
MKNDRLGEMTDLTTDCKSILLIEEDRIVADLVSLTLERMGYKVKVTSKPSEILTLMAEVKPRLVLLDIFLPGWNGLDLLRDMKRAGWLKTSKVLVLSALGFREVVQQAVMLGASDFLMKPFDVDVLVEKVEKTINATPAAASSPAVKA